MVYLWGKKPFCLSAWCAIVSGYNWILHTANMNYTKCTYLIVCGWSSFPLNPAWGKLKITLSNHLILRSVCSFIVFALTPCKVTAPIFFSSAKLDSAPLYFFFRVSVQDHLKINGNSINKKSPHQSNLWNFCIIHVGQCISPNNINSWKHDITIVLQKI